MSHEWLSRDHQDGCATEQPQGGGPEAYLNATSQGEFVLSLSKERPRTHGRTAISVVRLRRIHETSGLLWNTICMFCPWVADEYVPFFELIRQKFL